VPSSLIFAALAAAWLVVLVPMIAKRQQEVVRTAESALASRVLRRPGLRHAVPEHGQEVHMIGGWIAQPEPASDARRYRSGRGGYDPEVAAQLARAKYAFRQRVVLGLATGAAVTLVSVYAVSSMLWWVQAALDVALAGYLCYLRRQVQIEEEVRQRRAARFAGSKDAGSKDAGSKDAGSKDAGSEVTLPSGGVHHEVPPDSEQQAPELSPRPAAAASSAPHPTAVALDVDDEDPVFDELRPTFKPPYRRAVGE
jgi:hypothetical protein